MMTVTAGVAARATGILTVATLVAGFFTAAGVPSPAAAATVVDVPAPAPVAELQRPASSVPEGDFSGLEALVAPVPGSAVLSKSSPLRQGPPVRTLDPEQIDVDALEVAERTEFGTVFEAGDGTYIAAISPTPVHAQDAGGEWVPISTRLRKGADGSLSTDVHPLDPSFASRADDEAVFAVARDGFTVSFELVDAAPSDARTAPALRRAPAPAEVSYREVFAGVDLQYEVEDGGVKEELVLRELPAPDAAQWTWRVVAPGLRLAFTEFGEIEFVDEEGIVRFHIPVPIMWDSSGVVGESEPALANVPASLREVEGAWEFTLSPDYEWLSAKERVYPVHVDPALYFQEGTRVAYKSDGATRTDGVLVGNARSPGNVYWRTVQNYNYPQVAGHQVMDTFLLSRYAGEGSTSLLEGNVWLATCWGYSCTGGGYMARYRAGSGTTWYSSWDDAGLDARTAAMVRSGYTNDSMAWTGVEGTTYTYKKMKTEMYVSWRSFPVVSAYPSPSPANAATGVTLTPTFTTTASVADGLPLYYKYVIGTGSDVEATAIHTSAESASAGYQVPAGVLDGGTTYYWKAMVRDSAHGHLGTSTWRSGAVRSFTTNAPAPPADQGSTVPADGAVVTTLTPTFSVDAVTDPESDPVTYQFRIASGESVSTGAIVSSGWLTSTTWTVPEGSLQDGGSYKWTVLTSDGVDVDNVPDWTNTLRVNLRLGASGPSPYDSAGPATVNLANGNLSLGFSSPTVNTVGGPMGMSFFYNSQQSPTLLRGLTGQYYSALNVGQSSTTEFTFTGRTPKLVRTDPQVHFTWEDGSPGPAVPEDYFLARWTGFVTVPASGSYTFGVARDDGARVTIGGTQVYDGWSTTASGVQWGSASSMTVAPTAIEVEFYESTGDAGIQLWVRTPDDDEFIVPADWFSTKVQTLPGGWATSTPIAGAQGVYSSARVTEASVVLTDLTGSTHTYEKTSDGGYRTPVGEYGVLSLDAVGNVVLSEADGTVYTFNAEGALVSATSPADALKPSAPVVTYRENGVVDRISDPASLVPSSNPPAYTREVHFAYGGDSWWDIEGLTILDSDLSGTACKVEPGYAAPPEGMLCRIVYPGHVGNEPDTTRLLYDANGLLAAILDPGDEWTTFAYDGEGRLEAVRDSLANDWLAVNSSAVGDANRVDFDYDAAGRLQTVTLPAPDGVTDAARPQKTYTYENATTTYVDIAGLDVSGSALGHAGGVTFDEAWRQTGATSAMGVTSSQVWNAKDLVLSATNGQGLVSTTIYDDLDRVTDTYGPAPASCYGVDRRPLESCPIDVAHASTSYDYGLQGLHAAWYDNPSLAGAPVTFSLGLPGVTGGAVSKDWGAAAPIAGISAVDDWSVRLSGRITFPMNGTYNIQTRADGGTRVWIDDILVVDDWNGSGLHFSPLFRTVTAGGGESKSIRIAYREGSGDARLELHWTPPELIRQPVPGSALVPDYGLPNRTVVADSVPEGSGLSDSQVPDMVTELGYTHPWLGAVTSSTIDPDGLALTTTSSYETPGSGWLRRLTRTMPSGAPATSTSTYWGDAEELSAAICGVPAGTGQYGFLKSQTDSGGVVTEYVYDLLGRTAGTKRSGDADWSCVSFDARGRVVESHFAEFGDADERTVTTVHAVGGNPLISSVTDPAGTITATIDLLGRTVSSTDVWGTETTPAYEPLTGRVLSVTVSPPVGADLVQEFTYDLDGKLESLVVNGEEVADPDYDAVTQLLESVAYGNGTSLSGLTRNPAGAAMGMTWSFVDPDPAPPPAPVYEYGFEVGLDSWINDLSFFDLVETPVRTGSYSLEVTPESGVHSLPMRSITGLTPHQEYLFEAWVLAPVAEWVWIGVDAIYTESLIEPSDGWTPISVSFTPTSSSADLWLIHNLYDIDDSVIYLDDVTVTEVHEPFAPAVDFVSESVIRSQSGRIVQNTLTDSLSVGPEVSTYSFDAVGRLVEAVIPRHTLSYDYTSSACGVNANAGKNGNRVGYSDAYDTGAGVETTSVAYCYDHADRLTATTVTDAPAGANPVMAGNLTTTGPGASLAYDAHGNTTRLADQLIGYDVTDRHISTELDDGTLITYSYDASGRLIQREVTGSPTTAENGVYRYLAGGGAMAVADASNAVRQWVLSLPGGVSLTLSTDDSQLWGYPNLHGDIIVTADEDGARVGERAIYDPFGQPIDPVTWAIGTATADDAIPDLLDGDADFGWVGRHGKLTERHGSIHTIEMGVRQYVPALGRFLSVDPIEGGVTNAYDYPADPINKLDLTGMWVGILVGAVVGFIILGTVLGLSGDSSPPRPIMRNSSARKGPTLVSAGGGSSGGGGGGRGGGSSDRPPDNSMSGFDTGVKGCAAVVCVEYVRTLNDHGNLNTITVAGAAGLGVFGQVGGSVNKTPGLSVGWQCTGAIGPVSAYAGGGMGLFDGSWAWSPSIYGEGGWAPGAGAECSAGGGWSWAD